MFKYNLTSMPSFHINTKCIDNILNNIYKIVLISQKGTLNIVFLDQDSIKKLNNKYRKINSSTDVLSFHYFNDFSDLSDKDIAGELIFCEDKIKTQGVSYGLGEEKEFYKLFIHSILHILGYDHELDNEYKKMQELEDKIYKEVFEK